MGNVSTIIPGVCHPSLGPFKLHSCQSIRVKGNSPLSNLYTQVTESLIEWLFPMQQMGILAETGDTVLGPVFPRYLIPPHLTRLAPSSGLLHTAVFESHIASHHQPTLMESLGETLRTFCFYESLCLLPQILWKSMSFGFGKQKPGKILQANSAFLRVLHLPWSNKIQSCYLLEWRNGKGKYKLILYNIIQTHINITKKLGGRERSRKEGSILIFLCGCSIHTKFDKLRVKDLNMLFKVNEAITRKLKQTNKQIKSWSGRLFTSW